MHSIRSTSRGQRDRAGHLSELRELNWQNSLPFLSLRMFWFWFLEKTRFIMLYHDQYCFRLSQ